MCSYTTTYFYFVFFQESPHLSYRGWTKWHKHLYNVMPLFSLYLLWIIIYHYSGVCVLLSLPVSHKSTSLAIAWVRGTGCPSPCHTVPSDCCLWPQNMYTKRNTHHLSHRGIKKLFSARCHSHSYKVWMMFGCPHLDYLNSVHLKTCTK